MSIFSAPNFYSNVDRQIYNAGNYFIPQQQFRDSAFNITAPVTDEDTTTPTGINTVFNQGGGGGGVPFTGGIADLTTAFQKTVDDRQDKLTELNRPLTTSSMLGLDSLNQKVMDKIRSDNLYEDRAALNKYSDQEYMKAFPEMFPSQSFPGTFEEKPTIGRKIADTVYSLPFISKPQSAQQIMEEGYTGGTGGPSIIGAIAGAFDKFGSLSRPDQAFIQSNMGYTGPTVFGENTTGGSKDPFGLNVRSGRGNYAERVGVESKKLGDLLSDRMTEKYGKGTSGISFNTRTGMFEAIDPEDQAAIDAAIKATQMNKMNIAKYQYYTEKTKERDELRRQEKERQAAIDAAALQRAQREIADKGYQDYGSGGASAAEMASYEGDDGSYAGASTEDYGGGEKDGGFIDGTNRRMDFMMGGLADLVDIYD